MAEYRLRDGSALVVGPVREETIRDLIRAGAVGANAEVGRDDGPFVPIKDFEKIVPPPPWFQLEMAIGPMWANVALIQTSLLNYLSTVFRDQDYCDTLTMVVSELLENAIKHGDWARFPSALVKLRIRTDAKVGAMAEVSNPCTPDSGPVLRLMRTVAALNGSSSPRQAYQRRMIEIAQSGQAEIGGLGLTRIAYEAGCRLRVDVDPDNAVRVSAMLKAPERAQSDLQSDHS